MLVLAVHPTEPELAYFERMPPLGMLWIGGALRRAGHCVEFLDMQVDRRSPAEAAAALRPRLALIGGTSHSRFVAFEVAAAMKETSPETIVVYGGPHAAFTAHDTLDHVEAIDLVVRGEGEETAVEVAAWAQAGADSGRLPDIRGISYREHGAVRENPDRAPIADLDALGPPDRDLVQIGRASCRERVYVQV
jgi:anaerobic magnesium-protoporphyrin IX monomethyl ester cyclase